jgi:hypothetical protein
MVDRHKIASRFRFCDLIHIFTGLLMKFLVHHRIPSLENRVPILLSKILDLLAGYGETHTLGDTYF